MSTENPVGFFRDVVKVNGWDLDDFKKRQQPFLFGHNVAENRPPLGRMNKVKKDSMPYGRVLAGDAELACQVYPRARPRRDDDPEVGSDVLA